MSNSSKRKPRTNLSSRQPASSVQLCDNCKAIDFDKLSGSKVDKKKLSQYITEWEPCETEWGLSHGVRGTKCKQAAGEASICTCRCVLCAMFKKVAKASYQFTCGITVPIIKYVVQVERRFKEDSELNTVPGMATRIVVDATQDLDQFWDEEIVENDGVETRNGDLICLQENEDAHKILKPRPIPATFQAEKAAFWIRHCKRTHQQYCQTNTIVSGLRFIDCQQSEILPAPLDAEYVALSYRWPPSPPRSRPSIRTSSCPRVVRDAITVTRQLGFRYLWVDMFCIDQDDEKDKENQIGKMDLIYGGAVVTVMAAGSSQGLHGVSLSRPQNDLFRYNGFTFFNTGPDPWHEVAISEWTTRAWTFQEELLSRRRLIFTESQALFVCNQMYCCDAVDGPNSEDNDVSIERYQTYTYRFVNTREYVSLARMINNTKLRKLLRRNFEAVLKLIEQYTRRDMTNDSDSLRALLGILNIAARPPFPIYHIQGLPIPKSDHPIFPTHLPYQDFSYSLIWHHKFRWRSVRRRFQFPSCSWCGWDGEVEYLSKSIKWKPFIQNILLDGTRLTALGPRYPKVLQFEGYIVPPSCFSFEDQDDWQNWAICGQPIELGWKHIKHTISEQYRFYGNEGLGPFGCDSALFWSKINQQEYTCILIGQFPGSSHYIVVEGDINNGAERVGSIVTSVLDRTEREKNYLPVEYFDSSHTQNCLLKAGGTRVIKLF